MIKRFFDILLAGLMVVLLAPLLLCIAVLIRITMDSPVLFRQERPGLHGKIFRLFKFRTMRTATHDKEGRPLSDADRMTGLGKLLRRTSLDELPELFNVLRGEMSFVGPRPLLTRYLGLYTAEQMRRHDVRPGITGWAQVNGRNAISWERRFELDNWYVDHHSLWLDLKILWMTIGCVLKRDGISHPDHATMPEFRGTQRAAGE